MIDQTMSHYRILEKLGEGGMGEVFLAEDTSLNRKVALKFLPRHLQEDDLARKRLLREAESAAALEHPYICNIKEVARTRDGEDFIVMEYVEGQTLKDKLKEGPLPLQESLRIALEVADALEMAHGKGVVHRDLKPANIMLNPQGHAKVMDFGLAKRMVTEEGAEQDLTAGLTREGSTLGTPAYMSPEQIKAQRVDHRSDIFSFGIILYEMLTGIHPFRRHGSMETMGAILHESPEPLAGRVEGSSELLWDTVSRMLAKEPGDRIQSIQEVAGCLQGVSSQSAEFHLTPFMRSRPEKRLIVAVMTAVVILLMVWWLFQGGSGRGPLVSSIAVLPLVNLSGDPEQEYFADGMTDALITDLSRIGALKVISRSSSMRYKRTEKSLVEIARELDVEAVIEGSVLREEDQVRITAQLIEAATERNLWAERYTRNLTSILVLQGEVAQAIAREIQVTLTPGETGLLSGRREVDPEAYEAYLKGQFHLYKLTAADLETAHQYFNRALEKDPNYALAHFGIAFYWAAQQQMSLTSPIVAAPKVKAAVQRAYELDDMLPEVHYLMAVVKTWVDWDWEAAEVSFKRAIELNPNYAHLRAYYAQYLMTLKRQAEATTQMKLALELDPLNPLVQALHGSLVCYGDRRYDEAIQLTQKALQTEPNQPVAFSGLFSAFFGKGMFKEALEVQKRRVSGRGTNELAEIMATGYEAGGFREAFRRLADMSAERSRTTYVSALAIARAYTLAEDYGPALQWLERAFEDHDPNLPYIAVKPEYDSLRDDPRFQDLLGRMNLTAP